MIGRRALLSAVALLAVPLSAGCGSEEPDVHGDPGGPISYSPVGTTMTIDCGPGRPLSIGGSNNKLTVTGRCTDIEITGNDNRVTVDEASGAIRAGGVNNIVIYRDGKPKVSASGGGNTVRRG